MKQFAACLALTLLSSCSGQQPKIEDFAGDWETEPMSELFEIGIVEQIKDLRDGTHPNAADFDDAKFKDLLSLPTEEAKAKLIKSGIFGSASPPFAQADPIIGFTISPPSHLTAYISVNGERQSKEYEAEYELTSKEIVCKYEGGPTIFTISGDHLVTDNESEGYPKQFKLSRSPNGPNKTE